MVVFPARRWPRRRSLFARYTPFLVTVTLGAVVVVLVAVIR